MVSDDCEIPSTGNHSLKGWPVSEEDADQEDGVERFWWERSPIKKTKEPQRQGWGGACGGQISKETYAAISQCAEESRSQDSLCRENILRERSGLERTMMVVSIGTNSQPR